MNYETIPPCSDIAGLIKCYWTLEALPNATREKQRIIPDGCMEMIFHYGDVYRQYLPDGTTIEQPRCFVIGQITEPLEIEPTTGNIGMIAARFQPDGFIPFATLPLEEMENKAIALERLFGSEGEQLQTDVLAASQTSERIRFIEEFLLQRLQTDEAAGRISTAIVQTLMQTRGQVTIGEISKLLHINRRQLERRFSSAIGLSPKQFVKIIRLQTVLKMMVQKQFTSLTALALDGGYYDQAHFIKDFKEFVGMSPKQFYADNLTMNSLFLHEE